MKDIKNLILDMDGVLWRGETPIQAAAAGATATLVAVGFNRHVVYNDRFMFDEAVRRLGGTTADTAMVGDRLNTDIAGGNAAGLTTILLLSGISTQAEVADGTCPDYIFADIRELAAQLESWRDG